MSLTKEELWHTLRSPVGTPSTINEVEEFLTKSLQRYISEPNDQKTRSDIKNKIDTCLEPGIDTRVWSDFKVVCDESNNTPARIDNNELHVSVYIQPTVTINIVHISSVIKGK